MKYPCQKAKDLKRCANACLKKVNVSNCSTSYDQQTIWSACYLYLKLNYLMNTIKIMNICKDAVYQFRQESHLFEINQLGK